MEFNVLEIHDNRIPEVIKIVKGLVSSTNYIFTDVFISYKYNIAMIIVNDSVIYFVKLTTPMEIGRDISFNYSKLNDQIELYNLEEQETFNIDLSKLFDISKHYYLESKFNFYYSIANNPSFTLIADDDNLLLDDSFVSNLKIKAADGVKFYKMRSNDFSKIITIPMISGFPNINGGDKIGIEVYKDLSRNISTYIIVYNIYKKKFNRNMFMIFAILDL